jgi:hypothetical protein
MRACVRKPCAKAGAVTRPVLLDRNAYMGNRRLKSPGCTMVIISMKFVPFFSAKILRSLMLVVSSSASSVVGTSTSSKNVSTTIRLLFFCSLGTDQSIGI